MQTASKCLFAGCVDRAVDGNTGKAVQFGRHHANAQMAFTRAIKTRLMTGMKMALVDDLNALRFKLDAQFVFQLFGEGFWLGHGWFAFAFTRTNLGMDIGSDGIILNRIVRHHLFEVMLGRGCGWVVFCARMG